MHQGKVKWFNNAKGYGFIIEEGESEDLFVHFSSIQMEGYKTLKAGQRVEFEKQPSAKGIHAVNIIPHEAPSRRRESSESASQEESNAGTGSESRARQPESQQQTA
ncbi:MULTISPECIES: cold shock domain-containing protein [Gammaproteobacteria]|jgi:CspA family cold shock protein|uniref:Cold-shock protein n=1 Tax=Vreelandella halophila TaxID=86177 RepID=A0A9X4YBV4_9GAMM|nr:MULTISPECIES: cold shock domain-containing protein [Gammaproteobacteria]KAA8984403.1 cold-shock protein [Halospina sp. K52047b]MYL26869.1 cold-shock protein [Halomonas utahensis]MYL74130.1 cold-shock protein [Halomonas sp. 22501_18_FS]